MTIRPVTDADEEAIRELWEAFEAEMPGPPGYQPETWDEAWADIRRHAAEGVALIAEDDARPGRLRVRDRAARRALARHRRLRPPRRARERARERA